MIVAGVNSGETKIYNYGYNKIIKANSDDVYAIVNYDDNSTQKIEFYKGEGYFSQRSNFIAITKNIRSIFIVDYQGKKREVYFVNRES